jgi:hypothetical protein
VAAMLAGRFGVSFFFFFFFWGGDQDSFFYYKHTDMSLYLYRRNNEDDILSCLLIFGSKDIIIRQYMRRVGIAHHHTHDTMGKTMRRNIQNRTFFGWWQARCCCPTTMHSWNNRTRIPDYSHSFFRDGNGSMFAIMTPLIQDLMKSEPSDADSVRDIISLWLFGSAKKEGNRVD